MATTYTYPFDPTGSATTNAVANERHVLSPPAWSDYYFIVPKYAPYFRDSLRVIHRPSGKLLVEGKDYHCTHYFHAASHGVARRVYGSITMLDKTLTGVAEISYQTIGGDWILDASADLSRLTNTQLNPRITTWEQVVDVPYQFPPIDHEWDLENLKGVEAILPILEAMTEAIRESAGSDFQAHIKDVNNPHKVTKDQVGLDQVQNLPLANIAEAQSGSLNTRYMTPVRTKNLIDFYVLPLLEAHKTDLNNPHSTTKAQVGLGSVQNYGMATEAEARAGTVANKYMTPLQTKQAIETLANAGLATHVADLNNPHGTTKAQVGLPLVENLPLATIPEAQAASRNDRYMTPLSTAAAINTLVKESMDLHINATNNPHMVNKTQVGLGNVLNYGIASEAEAKAGAKNDVYMTPLMTRKAIEEIATGSIGSHLADDQNPHATTKAQVGLSAVQNFPLANIEEAKLGESNIRYMTPLLVKAAIDAQVSGGIGDHVTDVDNPHKVTAAQVGTYTSGTLDGKFNEKLNKLSQATDSAKLEGHSYNAVLLAAKQQGTVNSDKLSNQTLEQILTTAKTTTVDNAAKLEGKTVAQIGDELISSLPYTQQFRVPNLEYTIDGTPKWIPLCKTIVDAEIGFEELTLLFHGMFERDLQESLTGLINLNPVSLYASATILAGGPAPLELLYTNEDGVFSFWYKTTGEFSLTTLTVVSGKGFMEIDPAAEVLSVAPTGTVAIPLTQYANSKQVSTVAIHEQVSVAAGVWKEYNLTTLLGAANLASHNIPGTLVKVRALDTTPGSATLNMLIDADAMVTTAIVTGATPKIRILNAYESAQTLNIRIEVPRT